MGLLYKGSKLLNIILDSLEDQEGGAMYISCDVSNGGPVEPETGYVPNNPLFGLALDSPQQECAASCVGCLSCQGSTALPISSLTSSDFDCGGCFDPTIGVGVGVGIGGGHIQISTTPPASSGNGSSNHGAGGGSSGNHGYWSTDEMASTFPGLPPLDIDPLPSLFPFSPCGASYNFAAGNPHQASLSYTVHPHQMLISPNSHNHGQMHSQHQQHQQQSQNQASHIGNSLLQSSGGNNIGSNGGPSGAGNAAACYYEAGAGTAPPPPSTAMYPSMSVNVSMNMTMHHGYGTGDASGVPMQCSQMNWTPPSNSSSAAAAAAAVNVLYPPLLSPGHYPASATYSFTADFRAPAPTGLGSLPPLTVGEKESPSPPANSALGGYYPTGVSNQGYTPPHKSPSSYQAAALGLSLSAFEDEEDSNEDLDGDEGSSGGEMKPNLCRLCGKTYARPSTLKTHLRTHSGERPYRCPDCNKSFSQAANLTAHVRTHTGQKPFRCPICDRRFSQSSSVTTHMRTHSGERPYRCSSCKKSFSDSSTLTKHLRIHSGEKPYQCKLCLLRFSQSGNLNRHMRVHGNNNNNNGSGGSNGGTGVAGEGAGGGGNSLLT